MLKSKIFWSLIFVGGIIAIAIVYSYAFALTQSWYLSPVDSEHWLSTTSGGWGDFGSLLSGAFTLLSAIASLATLIFLLHQQRDEQKASRERDEKNEANRLEQLNIQNEIQKKMTSILKKKKVNEFRDV